MVEIPPLFSYFPFMTTLQPGESVIINDNQWISLSFNDDGSSNVEGLTQGTDIPPPVPPPLDDPVVMAEEMRTFLKQAEEMARTYAEIVKGPFCQPMHDKGEVIAQCMLALRHIEDARMRYGKCIQYATTGESSYQK